MGVEYGFEIVKLLIAVDVARSLVWPVRLWNTLVSSAEVREAVWYMLPSKFPGSGGIGLFRN